MRNLKRRYILIHDACYAYTSNIDYIIKQCQVHVRYDLPQCIGNFKGKVTKYRLEHLLLDCEDVREERPCSHTEKRKKWKQTKLVFA